MLKSIPFVELHKFEIIIKRKNNCRHIEKIYKYAHIL